MLHEMLILCIGPDTFRAQAKARELELAFREKYDSMGTSIERLSPGKVGVDELMERANTISLFSPKRFLRVTDLLAECPKAKYVNLSRTLLKEPENIIVVSVESEPPSSVILKALDTKIKIIKYEFSEQSGAAFYHWLEDAAKGLGIQDTESLRHLSEATDGDSWLAWNELTKLAASGMSDVIGNQTQPTIYEYADAYLKGDREKYFFLQGHTPPSVLLTFLSQARAALRVRDQATQGLHPYLVKKLQTKKIENLEEVFADLLMTLFCQRSSYGDEEEVLALL